MSPQWRRPRQTGGGWARAGKAIRSGRSGCGGALGHRRALDEGRERGRRRGLGRGGKEEDLFAYSWTACRTSRVGET